MTTARKRDVWSLVRGRTVETYLHERAPDASMERLRALAGIIKPSEPLPPDAWKFMEEEDAPAEAAYAGDRT